jgi:hypothetical protein
MKPIVLSEQAWNKLRQHLTATQPKSVMLVRSKMREVLGFTCRLYTDWVNEPNRYGGMGYRKCEYHLDFFDEAKRTMFLLKYTDWIQSDKDSKD